MNVLRHMFCWIYSLIFLGIYLEVELLCLILVYIVNLPIFCYYTYSITIGFFKFILSNFSVQTAHFI